MSPIISCCHQIQRTSKTIGVHKGENVRSLKVLMFISLHLTSRMSLLASAQEVILQSAPVSLGSRQSAPGQLPKYLTGQPLSIISFPFSHISSTVTLILLLILNRSAFTSGLVAHYHEYNTPQNAFKQIGCIIFLISH